MSKKNKDSFKKFKNTKKLTKSYLKKILENYIELENEDINNIEINSFIRYITVVNGKRKLRIGGYLKYIHKKYIILSNFYKNKSVHWSVQRKNNINFYDLILLADVIVI